MKKIILLTLIAAMSSMHLWGQTTPPEGTPYMEFTVTRFTTFKFRLQGQVATTNVWISTSPTLFTHQTVSFGWSEYQEVSATARAMTVRIYGMVKSLDAGIKTANENNSLSLIDVSKNPFLVGLSCYSAGVHTLDISGNGSLKFLECSDNVLTKLDVSQNTKLVDLNCANNQLVLLNVANGNNANVTKFNATSNPLLSCIQVDDGFTPTAIWEKDATAEWNNDSANPCTNTNSHQISFSTTKAVGETIKLGIFAESINQSTIWIDLNNNGIKEVGEVVAFFSESETENYVLGAQTISIYGKVKMLACYNNNLTSLDVSKNNELTNLECYVNDLVNINVSYNTQLANFDCSLNQITTLDLSNNIELLTLGCCDNKLENLNVAQNSKLMALDCSNNVIHTLDMSKNADLLLLMCSNNQLTSLNVANGNNTNVTKFIATDNPNLTCIQVDDGFISSGDWLKDADAQWNNDSANPCDPSIGINDLVLNRVKIFPNPAKEMLYITSDVKVQMVKLYNLQGQLVLEQEHLDAIPLRNVPTGMYQVMIFSDNGIYTEKMIKQ